MGVDAEMYVLLHQPITDAQLIDAAYRLAEAVKDGAFFFSNNANLEKGERRRALNRLTEHDDWFKPFDGDWLRVPLWGRYYGPGYERGSLWTYVAIAEWIERNLNATVYYGGDSGGAEDMIKFDKAARERLIAHWADKGGVPYYQNDGWSRKAGAPRPVCPLCERPTTQYGSGASFASWSCDACGRHWVWNGGEEVKMFDVQ